MGRIDRLHSKSARCLGLRAALLASTALFLAAQPAVGQEVEWTGGAGHLWTDDGNWSGGTVPTATDDVIINELTTAPGSGAVILYEAGEANELTVGDEDEARLAIMGGELETTGYVRLGEESGSFGIVLVLGGDSELISRDQITVGGDGDGYLFIDGGGVQASGMIIARGSDSESLVEVEGSGSRLELDGSLRVGERGKGVLRIIEGGHVISQGATIGHDRGGSGIVVVDGGGSLWDVTGFLSIGSTDADSVLTISNGATVRVNTGVSLAEWDGSGTINIGAATGETEQGAGTLETDVLKFVEGRHGTLIFNHTATQTDDYTFDVALESDNAGSHAIEHLAGVTNYIGDGSGFTGTTTISGGTLYVDDALGGSVNVDGGILGGIGTLGNVTINSGGTIAPGNSIGTLHVGSILFHPGSIYDVEIIGGGNTAGIHNDLIAVTGAATLDGGIVNVIALDPTTSYQDGQDYTILTAGSVSGEFDEAVTASAFITPTLAHNADSVVLTIALNGSGDPGDPTTGLFTTVAQTHNQFQAATGLDGLDQTPGSDALAVYNQILMLPEGEARRAFDLTSGEIHASSQHVIDQTFGLFSRTLRHQAGAGIGGGNGGGQVFIAPLAYGPTTGVAGVAAIDDATTSAYADRRVSQAWLAPLGGRGAVDANGNAAALDWWAARPCRWL